MSGPRVTTGLDSKQDYATPDELIAPVNERFGPIVFDLAAHALNKKSPHYFAPSELIYTLESFDDKSRETAAAKLVLMGAKLRAAEAAVDRACEDRDRGVKKVIVTVINEDPEAFDFDALAEDWHWAYVGRKATGVDGLLWLNCEFNDVTTWAARCKKEGAIGARIALLTPAMVGANWFRDLIAGHADVYYLNGRVCFDGKNPYPKDCMISIFGPGATGLSAVWDWRRNEITHEWALVPKGRRAAA